MSTSRPPRPEPRPYQSEGVRWLKEARRGILADEAGLGKSRQLIEASVGRTLIVAPAMVLDGGTWVDEVAKWADEPDRFTTVAYTHLSPYEPRGKGRAPSLNLGPEYAGPWDTVIMDEAHYVKGRTNINPKTGLPPSTRAYLAVELSKVTERVYLATGTPIPNWAQEVFTLLQIVDPDESLPGKRLGSYWRWIEEWFAYAPTEYDPYNIGGLRACRPECDERAPTDPCEHYHEFVAGNFGDRFLQRRRDDVLKDLPPLTEVEVQTPMGPKQKANYNRMKKEYVAESEAGNLVVAWSASAKNVRLDQITTGLDLLTEKDQEFRPRKGMAVVNNGKLVRLAQDLESRSTPTLVMAHYRSTVEAAAQVARDLGLRVAVVHGGTSQKARLERVREFQSGKLDVLVGSLETLAEGLTLTSADMLIFVEKSYKPSRNEQAMRRVHRIGQTRPVTILDYVTPNSVDAKKRGLLRTKTDGQMRVLTAAQFKDLL